MTVGVSPRVRRPVTALRRRQALRSVAGMDITTAAQAAAATGPHSPGLPRQILAVVVLGYVLFAVAVMIASAFSSRWRRITVRAVVIPAGAIAALYLAGRAIAEFFLVNYADPASYRNAWGGPSLAGVFAVHAGPGLAVLIAAIGWLYRRRHRHHHGLAQLSAQVS